MQGRANTPHPYPPTHSATTACCTRILPQKTCSFRDTDMGPVALWQPTSAHNIPNYHSFSLGACLAYHFRGSVSPKKDPKKKALAESGDWSALPLLAVGGLLCWVFPLRHLSPRTSRFRSVVVVVVADVDPGGSGSPTRSLSCFLVLFFSCPMEERPIQSVYK